MATFTVTNLDNAGAGSLRNAIFQANTVSTTDDIAFNSSLSGGTINLTSGELGITDDLTINGLGADLLSVDAGGNSRVFNVDDGDADNDLKVAIDGLTITGGNPAGFSYGGGILNSENLTVSNSTISGNSGANGGGIYTDGSNLTVTNSIISGNSAGANGGGIYRYPSGGGIFNAQGNLTVTNSTISGNSAKTENSRGGGISNYDGDVTVSNSTISGNTADFGGGGIYNSSYGDLTVSNSTISGNTADFGGGGILGNLMVTNSTISGNTAGTTGGGIAIVDGDATVSNSTISGNTAAEYSSGGIFNLVGNLMVTNSTISGNTAGSVGGGINNVAGNVTVSNSTISGNTAQGGGGGINNSDVLTVTSSIIADNTDNNDIGGGPFTSGGNNLIGNGDGAEGFTNGVNGDQVGSGQFPIDPLLGELQDNGGPTQTQALLPGSPAINAGSNPEGLEFDQRGPGFDRVIGAQADIGAYEVPEPDSALGLLLGLPILGVVFLRRRRQR